MSLTADEQHELETLTRRRQDYMNQDWLSPAERSEFDRITGRIDALHRQGDVPQRTAPAVDNVQRPTEPSPSAEADPAGSVPSSVMPTSFGDHHSNGPDLSRPIESAPPVSGVTKYLPLTGNEKYDATIRATDDALDRVNKSAFNLNPNDVNGYDSAHLGGPSGPSSISNLSAATQEMHSITDAAKGHFEDVTNTWNGSGDDQTWSKRMSDAYKPMMEAASGGVGTDGAVGKSTDLLDQAGGGAAGVFNDFHGSIASARDSIAGLYGTDEHGNRYLDTSRSLNFDPSLANSAQAKIQELSDTSGKLGTSLDDWDIPVRTADDGGSNGAAPVSCGGDPAPSNAVPSNNAPSTGDLSGGDPSAAAPSSGAPSMPSMPSAPSAGMPSMPSMSGGDPMSSPAGEGDVPADQGGTHLTGDTDGGSAISSAGDDRSAPSATAPRTQPTGMADGPVTMSSIPRPGDPVRPGALGADGKPLDKDGDGLMDKDAIAATKENMDPDGDGRPNPLSVTVTDADGNVHEVTTTDPRLAEMMTRLAAASDDDPKDIISAAKESGVPLEDLGEEIDIVAVQPGDVVTGTDTGMYMGDGKVLTEDGHVKSLADVMDFDKSDPKITRLQLPELPSDDAVMPEASATEDSASDNSPAEDAHLAGESHSEPAHAAPEPARSVPADTPFRDDDFGNAPTASAAHTEHAAAQPVSHAPASQPAAASASAASSVPKDVPFKEDDFG